MRLKASWWLLPKLLLVQELAFNDKSIGRNCDGGLLFSPDKASMQKLWWTFNEKEFLKFSGSRGAVELKQANGN
jgi:hypothetical protein